MVNWLEDMEQLSQKFKLEKSNKKEKENQFDFPNDKLNQLRKLVIGETRKLTSEEKRLVEDVNVKFKDFFKTDEISNLCLLDSATNKGIGNNPFNKKRLEVLTIAKNGCNKYGDSVFMPLGTQRVFSKFYRMDENTLYMTFWGGVDRSDYLAAMSSSINSFLKPETNGN